MRKILIMMATAMTLIFSQQIVSAESTDIGMMINDSNIEIGESLIVEEETTFIETRKLVELMDASVEWNEELRTVVLNTETTEIIMSIDKTEVSYNGLPLEIEQKPFIKDGISYLPLKFIAQTLGCEVEWDEEKRAIILIKEDLIVDPKFIKVTTNYTEEDVNLLAKIVTVETGDLPIEVKLAVANVVLNRVKSDNFPGTISKVIYQKGRYTQFPPAHKSSFKNLQPSSKSLEAAKRALDGENNIENCLYFNNRPFKGKSDDLYKKLSGEYFYR